MISGFTIVRNAVRLDYPIVPAIRSIGDPCVRILDTEWDFSRGSGVLAFETNRTMAACRGAWGVYIQADEVLHEAGASVLREKLAEWDRDSRVEGLLVDYVHFYGDFVT